MILSLEQALVDSTMSAVATLREDGKTALRILSNSEQRVFRACMRRHYYAYRLLRRPRVEHEALRFGSLWHVGQEAWHGADQVPGARLDAAISAMQSDAENVDPYALVMCEELVTAYTALWADAPYRTVAVEQRFDVPLVNPETNASSRTFRIGGKLDVIVASTENGRLYVMEHKTTSSDIEIGSSYWRKVSALDTQVSTYLAGAKVAGYDVESCIYDVVRKPGIRPLKATPEESRKYTREGKLYANQREHDETPTSFRMRLRADIAERPERYFARGEVVRLESDERDHAFDTWQIARLMREAEIAGYRPKNPDACSTFGQCPYFGVCEGRMDISDDLFFRTASTPHEELETA